MPTWDDLIAQVNEADRAILAKYPKVKEKIQELEGKYQHADEYVSRWEEWKKAEWDDDLKMPKAAAAELRAREARIAELEATQGTEMDWDQIQTKLNEDLSKRGLVSRDDLKDPAKLRELGLARQDSIDNVAGGMQAVYAKTAPLIIQHDKEFGEPIDMEKFMSFMGSPAGPKDEKGLFDFKKGYDQFVGEKRAAKQAEARTVELAEARKDEREKTLKELNMGQNGRMPTDQKGSNPDMSWYQKLKMSKLKNDKEGMPKLADGLLGTGASGDLAYEAWLSGQQGGKAS